MDKAQKTSSIQEWAEENFSKVNLLNQKRTKRLVDIANRLAKNESGSLSRLYDSWYDSKATYNLFNKSVMKPEIIQSSHQASTWDKINHWDGKVLLLEDTSQLTWSGRKAIDGLNKTGGGRDFEQGFLLHTTLAVGCEKEVHEKTHNRNTPREAVNLLGIACQQFYVRPDKTEDSKRNRHQSSKHKTADFIETDLWRTVVSSAKTKGLKSQDIIRVCDRGADIYEVFQETQRAGWGYVIRVSHDRALLNSDSEIKRIFAYSREQKAIGKYQYYQRGRQGFKERTIDMQLSVCQVCLRAPYRAKKLEPIHHITVVRVWGIDPQTGKDCEWFLYTHLPTDRFEEA